MIKLILVSSILVITVTGDHLDKNAEIQNYVNEVNADGSYRYSFDATNGISLQESGVGGQSVSGSAGWIAPDGAQYQLTWTADATGFHPQGAHLPTPPPVPDYILRALETIRARQASQPQVQQQQQVPIAGQPVV